MIAPWIVEGQISFTIRLKLGRFISNRVVKGWFYNVQVKLPTKWTLRKRCLDAEDWFYNKITVQTKILTKWTLQKDF